MKEIIKRWNTWWIDNKVPENKKQIIRKTLLDKMIKLIKAKEIIVITGVRRCGKSTLVYQIINHLLSSVQSKNILYFNFDEPLEEKTTDVIEKVFRTFLEINNPKGKKYIFFDEIQNIPRWEQWIKKYYDLYGSEIKFIITGSNNSMLSSNLSKLLTGRIFTTEAYPLSFKEYLEFNNLKIKDLLLQREEIRHYFAEFLHKGGFPEVVLEKDPDLNKQRLREYFDGILLRDIITSRNIRETAKLEELAHYATTNISTEFSYNKISKATGININSLIEYLSFLEDAYLIFQLKYFSYSVKESIRVQKPRKIYCIDNGLRNAVSFKFSKDDGKLAENLVFVDLKRKKEEFYYWKGSKEVDFIIKNKDNSLTGINVSYGDSIKKREIEGLLELKKSFKNVKELIILTDDIEKKESGINYIPLWKWILTKD